MLNRDPDLQICGYGRLAYISLAVAERQWPHALTKRVHLIASDKLWWIVELISSHWVSNLSSQILFSRWINSVYWRSHLLHNPCHSSLPFVGSMTYSKKLQTYISLASKSVFPICYLWFVLEYFVNLIYRTFVL